MSVSTLSLIESLLQHDRPGAWFGLDTANPLTDDSGNGYTLTAVGAPANAATLHTRGDTGASGCRNFDGAADAYFTAGSVTDVPEGPPPFHASSSAFMTSATATVVSPGGVKVGDLLLIVSAHPTATATVTTGPSGFTQVGSTLNAGTHAVAVYRKTAVQADTVPQEVSLVWNSSAAVVIGMLVYRGLDSTVANLIYDSGQQATTSDTFHSTTTETHPDGARRLVLWTKDVSGTLDPYPTGKSERISVSNGNLQLLALDYEAVSAGSSFRTTTSSVATQLGAILITFGAPRVVLDDVLDTLAANLTLGCLVNLDTVVGTDTIARKHQAYGVHLVAGVVTFLYRDGGGVDRTVSGPTLTTGVTYRLWVVDDGTNILFFVNGAKTSAARVGAAGYTTNANRLTIGAYFDGATNSNFLDGRIDELALFPAALSEQMIVTHEQAATSGTFGQYLQSDQSRYPRGKVEIALLSNPTARCHSFSDVTPDIRAGDGLTTQRGRNMELDRMQAATLSFVLSNRDQAYATLKPTRVVRVRVQVSTDAAVLPRFFGYTDAPRHNRPEYGSDATVSIQASDIFKALALDKVRDPMVRPSELPGERIAAVLEDVSGLPVSLDVGVHQIIGDDLQGTNRLEHCQAVAETDGGAFFADARGQAVFQDNQYRARNSRTVQATYGGENTSAPYKCKELTPEVDESRLFTAAAVSPASGVAQRAVNSAAVAEYFERTKEVTTLHASDADALAMAHHFTDAYSTPLVRIRGLVLQPAAASSPANMWAAVLAHDISQRVKTIEKPIGASVETEREHFIEGISETLTASDWLVSLALSPVELEGNYFVIGTSAIGDPEAVIGW